MLGRPKHSRPSDARRLVRPWLYQLIGFLTLPNVPRLFTALVCRRLRREEIDDACRDPLFGPLAWCPVAKGICDGLYHGDTPNPSFTSSLEPWRLGVKRQFDQGTFTSDNPIPVPTRPSVYLPTSTSHHIPTLRPLQIPHPPTATYTSHTVNLTTPAPTKSPTPSPTPSFHL